MTTKRFHWKCQIRSYANFPMNGLHSKCLSSSRIFQVVVFLVKGKRMTDEIYLFDDP